MESEMCSRRKETNEYQMSARAPARTRDADDDTQHEARSGLLLITGPRRAALRLHDGR